MPVPGDELGNFAVGIVQIPEHANARHAGGHTGGFSALFKKFDAKAALLDVPFFLDDSDMIGACGNAVLASDTLFFVDQDDPVLSLVGGARRANRHAGRIVAVLALDRQKLPVEIGELPEFPFFEVIVRFILPQVVLILAGDAAGIAADAFRLIDDHPVFSHIRLFTPFSHSR
jgi:hypothetical protein